MNREKGGDTDTPTTFGAEQVGNLQLTHACEIASSPLPLSGTFSAAPRNDEREQHGIACTGSHTVPVSTGRHACKRLQHANLSTHPVLDCSVENARRGLSPRQNILGLQPPGNDVMWESVGRGLGHRETGNFVNARKRSSFVVRYASRTSPSITSPLPCGS